ncbi:MAG: AzlD domain-containing protein [Oscillospiraceae bacterium]|nr:AzlD domain-containing protein [Oscillospiraceae bacterium]MCI9363137.1 AzlD domain-containing protein [Oscillospiraceae bacterium]MCI9668280.1 AzlD domain-containing protein [Oscillospiraceae bacterium]RKJ58708.1 AzlD domain-containing protein [bacterium 1XD42-8]RKJ67565.1 AzlD domain-containing protein [bacterium 1XD42-1]
MIANPKYFFTCAAVMALVTYLVRMIPLVFMKRKIESRFIQSFLYYVPYAVLAAMTFPDIFSSTASPLSAAIGLLAALFLAWRGKGLLTVALGASAAVFLAERIFVFLS